VIDARDAAQYAKEHIPGAVNIEWRQVMAKSGDIPKNKPVLIYCNTGGLCHVFTQPRAAGSVRC
jgi:rhodanese-related sulfurtransferase